MDDITSRDEVTRQRAERKARRAALKAAGRAKVDAVNPPCPVCGALASVARAARTPTEGHDPASKPCMEALAELWSTASSTWRPSFGTVAKRAQANEKLRRLGLDDASLDAALDLVAQEIRRAGLDPMHVALKVVAAIQRWSARGPGRSRTGAAS